MPTTYNKVPNTRVHDNNNQKRKENKKLHLFKKVKLN